MVNNWNSSQQNEADVAPRSLSPFLITKAYPNGKRPSRKKRSAVKFGDHQGNPEDWTLLKFLKFCWILSDNAHVIRVINRHKIFHWSAFKSASLRKLKKLGFKWGPAQLIFDGVEALSQWDDSNS